MSHRYGYNKHVQSYYQRLFRRYSYLILALIVVGAAAVIWLVRDTYLSNRAENQPLSKLETHSVGEDKITYKTARFQFQDSSKWVFNTKESSGSKFVYYKYQGLEALRQLQVYVDQVPIPLNLAATRVLPVHIVNAKSLEPTSISGPCVGAFTQGVPHQEREVSFSGTTMLCNPDSPRYVVAVAEAGGDYRIKMLDSKNSSVQFVILYRDLTLDPGPDTLKNVVSSFQAI